MIIIGISIAIIIIIIISYLFSSKKDTSTNNNEATREKVVEQHVILSEKAKLYQMKYSFQNSFKNSNAVTICCSVVCIPYSTIFIVYCTMLLY